MIERRLLAIYLNDHLAGATAGVELARRARSSNRGTSFGEKLASLSAEIEADRETLERIMEQLGVKRSPAKTAAAWAAEKLGRLKLNGRLTGYSPLSRLLELEMLQIGITGKLELWQALEQTQSAELSRFDLAGLIERAESQRATAEALRLDAAREAFAGESSRASGHRP
ncbi:MAG TPA: hypothetical protein VGC63_02690 [Solirubrobacterales bacterium]